MTDLLKEAIADAKAVREVALANAKLALEEAFTPRLQSMLASKLSEEAEEEDGETVTAEGEGEDEMTDESFFAEGEDEEPPVEEAEEESEEVTDESYFSEGEGEDAPAEEETSGDESMEEGEGEEDEDMMEEDLMEIIRQLEEDTDSSEIGTGDNKKPSNVASDSTTDMKKEKLVQMVEGEDEQMEEAEGEDEVDIQEILRSLREEEEGDMDSMEEGDEPAEEEEPAPQTEAKLREAYAVIQFLRGKLNEINLLNSKLLFSNKLFRSHSLTESQKITVIENFDRATCLREVKLVYATLAESLRGTKNKTIKPIRESYASKPVASTRPSKAILSESNQMADRLRKLAGIK